MVEDKLPAGVDLFIAMVSGDAIVLAKLVRTLCPRHVLLFSTPYARRRGWEENARRMLEGIRGRLIEGFCISPLPEGEFQAELSTFRQGIQSALNAATGPEFDVALDCTTGQGVFRILGYEAVRQAVAQRGWPFRVVFCDGDSGSIILAAIGADPDGLDVQPIRFRFSGADDPLSERFSMYDVTTTGATRLWSHGTPHVGLRKADSVRLLSLFDELCRNKRLRAFFHSYWNLLRSWRQQQDVARAYTPDHMQGVVQKLINDFANRTSSLPAVRASREVATKIRAATNQSLSQFIGSSPSNAAWLDKYLQDQRLTALNRSLQNDMAPKIKQILRRSLCRGGDRTPNHSVPLDRTTAAEIRRLIQALRQELDRMALAGGHDVDPLAVTVQEHRAFREQVLDHGLKGDVRRLLTQATEKTGDLFELCAGWAVARIIDTDPRLRDAVACVHQNVNFLAGTQSVCELDTLVTLQTGDIFAFEAKTHYENADRKKIEANIKQLRDFGGAYSGYGLLYPLTRSEVERLAQGDAVEIRDLASLGMSDVHKWAEHIRKVRESRDQRIIGVDELESTLYHAARIR